MMANRDPDSISPFELKTGMDPFVSALRVEQIDMGYRLREVDPLKVAALKVSIEELGLRMPITVSGSGLPSDPEARFKLVAGAHRLAAVKDLGRDYIGGYVVDGDDLDAELWEIDENLCRAELTPADRALCVFRRKEIYLLKHPETAAGLAGAIGKHAAVANLATAETQRFTANTASATGQSERAVQRDAERGEKISDKALRMLRGTRHDKGVVLDRLKALRDDEQEVYVKALFDTDRTSQAQAKQIRTDTLATKRAIRTGVINAIAAHGKVAAGKMPVAAYAVGYADPPWQQEAWSDETGQDKGLQYPPMPLNDIKALCAGDSSPFTRDAKLYLWVPTNRIDDGIEVLRAWGFDFVSMITWDKVHIGMGREVRDRTEHLLIGKRGDFPGLIMGTQTESLYAEVKGGHSRKPVWFAEQIDRLYPDMRKLELFQRKASLADHDVRSNGLWDFWGFEAGDDSTDSIAENGDSIDVQSDPVDENPDSAPRPKLPPRPGKTAPVEFSVGGMRKGSYARFGVNINVDDTYSIFGVYEIAGYAGGSCEPSASIPTFESALRWGLASLARPLRAVAEDRSSVCTKSHRACARAGMKWIEEKYVEWGLGATSVTHKAESEAA